MHGYTDLHLPWQNYPTSRLYFDVKIGGIPARALLDSGASKTVISAELLDSLKSKGVKFHPNPSEAKSADGSAIRVLGTVVVPIYIRHHSTVNSCLIVPDLPYEVILGIETLKGLNAVVDYSTGKIKVRDSTGVEVQFGHYACSIDSTLPAAFPSGEKENFETFLIEWKEKFSKNSGITTLFKHKMYIDPNRPPIKQRYYRTSPSVQKELHRQVDELLDGGLIEESESPWSSPVLLVPKKNGKQRMCIDYRKVNDVTRKYAYPLPLINEILDKLKDAYYLSALDLQSGFHQIALDDDTKPYTAFTVPGRGLYQFKVLPFGLSNAPTSFQSLMDRVLKDVLNKFVFVYLDDILVIGRTFEEHQANLKKVFELLHEANLLLNWEKCFFLRPEVEYLGFVVGSGQIKVSPKKISSVQSFPPPKTVTQVKSFLGLCSFYRRFIPNFSDLASPITSLTKKGVPFVWSEKQQVAFNQIKRKLISAPVLHCPDFSQRFEIQTDASNVGLGAVLVQRINDEECVVSYASRTLSNAEKNYTVTERECLGVLFGVETFRPYVEGQEFTVITDHSSLIWLSNIAQPTGRLARWILRLGQFNMVIQHRKGRFMAVPDALSRIPYNLEVENVSAVQIPETLDLTSSTDPWYLTLKNRINTNPDAYPMFLLKDNLLFKQVKLSKTGAYQPRLVIPADFRDQIMQQCHSAPASAHLGFYKTLQRIKSNFYWPQMATVIKHFVSVCQLCQQHKPNNRLPLGHMSDTVRMLTPGKSYAVDIVGPLPRTRRQNKYIVVFLDLCTKWLVARPLRAATSQAISKVLLEDIIFQFGVPEFLLSDNGSQFVSNAFKDLCKSYHITQGHTPLYFPSANPVERYNRSIKTSLSIFVNEDHRSWDEYLQYIVFALRTAVSETTGFTPAKLTFGRELRSLFHVFKDIDSSDLANFNPDLYNDQLSKELVVIYKKVVDAVQKSKTRQARVYNLRHRPIVFKQHDLVFRKNFPKSNALNMEAAKLFPKFLGPFKISRVVSPTQYELETISGRPAGNWNVSHLKPCCNEFG